MDDNKQIPTTIINGFLGSGKTTIISHLIDYLIAKDKKVVYVKNEIGEMDLDAKLMRGKNIVSQELLNGCICCTLVGPFIASIDEISKEYNPDRIIIESAGSADPASLALMVENHPKLRRDGVIVVIDVLNFNGYEKIDEVSKRQTEFTDLIVFNKVEEVDNQRKSQVVGYIRVLNEKSPIVEAPGGKINPDLVFGLGETDLGEFIKHHPEDHHQEKDDQISAFTYISDKKFTKESLNNFLSNLPKNIFRVKGIFQTKNKPLVVNGVFNRFDFENLNETVEETKTKLIFIGYKAENNKEEIFSQLQSL
ncbi:MAG: GTP-binding protein [Candidatus Pacebacteria bacterium]|nr:GTP-binding protein [Candidatus Paceibacterota bacterium]